MATPILVQGDTAPVIKAQLTYNDYTPLNLANCAVVLQMRREDDKRYTINSACSVTNASEGRVEYYLAANDLNTPGDYLAQYEVTYQDLRVQTTAQVPVKIRRE